MKLQNGVTDLLQGCVYERVTVEPRHDGSGSTRWPAGRLGWAVNVRYECGFLYASVADVMSAEQGAETADQGQVKQAQVIGREPETVPQLKLD